MVQEIKAADEKTPWLSKPGEPRQYVTGTDGETLHVGFFSECPAPTCATIVAARKGKKC